MTAGQTFIVGTPGFPRVNGANWGEQVTVVRLDPQSYGVKRYLVRDSHGRHAYAY